MTLLAHCLSVLISVPLPLCVCVYTYLLTYMLCPPFLSFKIANFLTFEFTPDVFFSFAFLVSPGVIQNGARVLSRGLFPGVRPLPITPIGMTAAIR